MKGKEHLVLSLLFSIFVFYYYGFNKGIDEFNQTFFFIFLAFGSLIPDIDTEYALIKKRDYNFHGFVIGTLFKILATLGYVFNLIIYLSLYMPSQFLLKLIRIKTGHRTYFHSIFIGLIIAALIELITENDYMMIGFIAGFTLHLIEDSFTKTGIKPFNPLFNLRIAGNHETNRISFKIMLLMALFLLLDINLKLNLIQFQITNLHWLIFALVLVLMFGIRLK